MVCHAYTNYISNQPQYNTINQLPKYCVTALVCHTYTNHISNQTKHNIINQLPNYCLTAMVWHTYTSHTPDQPKYLFFKLDSGWTPHSQVTTRIFPSFPLERFTSLGLSFLLIRVSNIVLHYNPMCRIDICPKHLTGPHTPSPCQGLHEKLVPTGSTQLVHQWECTPQPWCGAANTCKRVGVLTIISTYHIVYKSRSPFQGRRAIGSHRKTHSPVQGAFKIQDIKHYTTRYGSGSSMWYR